MSKVRITPRPTGELYQEPGTPRYVRRVIPLDEPPTRLDALSDVLVWHVRNVLLDCRSQTSAAKILKTTSKTLWEMRKKYGIKEFPYGADPEPIDETRN